MRREAKRWIKGRWMKRHGEIKQGHNSQKKENHRKCIKCLPIKNKANRSSIFLHGPLGGLAAFGLAAQEYTHWDNEYQESGPHHRGHQYELAITGVIPGSIHCGTNHQDMRRDMHHIDFSEVKKYWSGWKHLILWLIKPVSSGGAKQEREREMIDLQGLKKIKILCRFSSHRKTECGVHLKHVLTRQHSDGDCATLLEHLNKGMFGHAGVLPLIPWVHL